MAVPALLTSLLQTMVFVVDRIMLGHHAFTALAGMQIAGLLEWSAFALFIAFEVGTIARVGRHVGAKEPERARIAAWTSLAMAVGLGLVLTAVTPLLSPRLGLFAPRASLETVAAAREYLDVTLAASPVVFLAMGAVATLQAGGDTRTPLAIGIFSNLVHVGLNGLLIFGGWGVPAMGLRGCAWSTAITFAIEAVLAILALSRRGPRAAVSLRRRGAGVELSLASVRAEGKDITRVAGPALVERVLYQTGFLAFGAMIALLGDAVMAADQALVGVESICFLSADAFGVAAAALVAQKLGARRPDEAEASARVAVRDAIVVLSVLGVLFTVGRWQLFPLFSDDVNVVAIGAGAAPVLAIAQPFMATAMVLAQGLRGAGFTREVLVVSALGTVLVRLAATWLFALHLGWGLVGVVMGSTSDWVVRALLLVLVGRSRARRLREGGRMASMEPVIP